MPCTVTTSEDGKLRYRLRWKGLPGYESKESTGIPDDRAHRAQRREMEHRARLMSLEMKAGKFDYLAWFPEGSKAAHFRTRIETTTVGDYIKQTWLPRQQPPLVRRSTAKTYGKHVRCHILSRWEASLFADVTTPALEDFRTMLIGAEGQGGKGLAVKTARDVIDATFRAIYRDARKAGLAEGDPFAALTWPRKIVPEPDPFDEKERDTLCDYFYTKDRSWYPFVYWQFWVGTRPSEAIGLRRGRLDVKQGKVSIVVSRTEDEDNPPKTEKSRRTITLLRGVVRMLHEMPRQAVPKPDDFVFTTPDGHPVDRDRFVEQHWHRALSATGIRPRGFYSTRDTFISRALERGAKIKWVADYSGTSVEMIERHYAKWLQGDDEQLRLLAGEIGPDRAGDETTGQTGGGRPSTPSSNRAAGPISRVKVGKNGSTRDRGHLRKVARKH